MRFARWRVDGAVHDGLVVDDDGVDRVVPFERGETVLAMTQFGLSAALEHAGYLVERARLTGTLHDAPAFSEVEVLAPIEAPSVRDFVAFEEHVEGVVKSVAGTADVNAEWYEFPTFYFANPHTLIGSGAVVRPPVTSRLDFELEVAAVIGRVEHREGRDLDAEEAAEHIFGYAVFNDWSARDLQSREMKVRLGPCKGKDFASTLGPWIVTSDEVASLVDADGFLPLEMEVFVNDRLIGRDLLSNMGWPFAELVAYASRDSIVMPGDVLGSGTAGNGGCLAELWGRSGSLDPAPLEAGDEVRMRVRGLGEILNVVGEGRAPALLPPARSRSRARTV